MRIAFAVLVMCLLTLPGETLAKELKISHQWPAETDARDRATRIFIQEVQSRAAGLSFRIHPQLNLKAEEHMSKRSSKLPPESQTSIILQHLSETLRDGSSEPSQRLGSSCASSRRTITWPGSILAQETAWAENLAISPTARIQTILENDEQ